MDHETTSVTRRRLLKGGAGAVTAGVAATAGTGSATAQADAYGGHLTDTSNFGGETADATGQDEVTVSVGAGTSGLLFDPAAVLIDPGTTVKWEWTGNGGAHNVLHDVDEPLFQSGDPVDDVGVLYEHTFEQGETGAHPYICVPHEAAGMKGVIAVGEDNLETDTYPFGQVEETLNTVAIFGGSAVLGGAALLGISAYHDMFGDEE